MAKKKGGGKNKSGDTASEKGEKKKYSEPSHAEDKVTKDEDGLKGSRAKSKRGNTAEEEKTKSNLADEGSVVTRRYSTRGGVTVDEKAKGETSGAKKIGKNAQTGKGKLEEDSEMVKTPAKRRKVDHKEADASVLSNEKSSYNFRKKRAITCFRKVDLSDSDFHSVIGKKVRLHRSGKLCTGRIESYNVRKNLLKVVYDDDTKGDLDITQEFELEIEPGKAYNCKEGSSARKGKSVLVEDDETKENQSKLKEENTSSVSKGRFTKEQKGKSIAIETNKVRKDKKGDSEPVEKIIKLGEPVATRAAKERGSKSQKKGSANHEKPEHVASLKTVSDGGSDAKTASRKTKKVGDETNVESRKTPVRNTRANARTRN